MYVYIWLAALVVFLIAELATAAMVSLWFVGGAAAALIAAVLGASGVVQFVLFVIVSAALLVLFRPFAKRYFPPAARFGTDRLLGAQALTTERIDNLSGSGAVKIDGKTWTARSVDGTVIEADTVVRICSVEGVKLLVEPAEKKGESQ